MRIVYVLPGPMVPVVNPGRISLKTAEALVGAGLSHSKLAYMTPPKVASGAARFAEDLLVSKYESYSETH